MQKYTAPVRVYKYPFELVMAAYERRFPTCPLIPVFVGSDKILESTSEDGAVQVIERRCTINVDAPYLLRKITGVDHVMFIQRNTLDRRKRVLKIEAWNESFSNHINIHELCYYKASKENENWTTFDQQASLEVKSFFGFEHVVERLAVKHYSANVKKGEEIIEFHVAELAQEGVTYLAPFEDPLPLNKKNGVMNGTSAETAAAALGSRAANGSQRVHGNEHCASDLEAEGEVGGGGGGGGGGQEVMVPFSALSSILSPL